MTSPSPPQFPPGFAEEDNSQSMMISCIAFIVINFVLLGVRIWARWSSIKRILLEDWVFLVGWILCVLTDGIYIIMVRTGLGRHIATLSLTQLTIIFRYFWLSEAFYYACVTIVKISAILFFMRIFDSVRWFIWLARCILALMIPWGIISTVVSIVQCNPVPAAWDHTIHGQCISLMAFFVATAIVGAIADLVVLIMPLPLLYSLRLTLAQKLALVPVFGVGFFALAVAGIRIASFFTGFVPDLTYDLSGPMWSVIEMNVVTICAMLPSVRIVLVRVFSAHFSQPSQDTPLAAWPPTIGSAGKVVNKPKTWRSSWSKMDNSATPTDVPFSSRHDGIDEISTTPKDHD